MKIRSIILLLGVSFFLVQCTQGNKTLRTASGYDFVKMNSTNGPTAEPGQYVYFEMLISDNTGEVLQSMRNVDPPQAAQIPLEGAATGEPNPILDVLSMIAVGDTAELIIPIDSMPGNNPQLAGKEYIKYVINANEIVSKEEYDAKVEEARAKQAAMASVTQKREIEVAASVKETLAAYKNGSLKGLKKMPSGLEYVVHEMGDGSKPVPGEKVNAHYYGVVKSDGSMFDNSFKRGQEFSFTIGQGQVIKGWDEGMAQYPRGSKATIFIPYMMAYGEAGRPPSIPAKSDLVFYVELSK